jgi:hypothetical protein
MGGGSPEDLAAMGSKVKSAWREAGRDGEPRIVALAYYGLGESSSTRRSQTWLRSTAWPMWRCKRSRQRRPLHRSLS